MKQFSNIFRIILLSITILLIACCKDDPIEIYEPMRINQIIKYMHDLPQQKTIYIYDDNKIKIHITSMITQILNCGNTQKKQNLTILLENEILILEFKYADSNCGGRCEDDPYL